MALSTPFPEVVDELDWPHGHRSMRSEVRGFRTTYRQQMAVPASAAAERRQGIRLGWLDAAVAVVVIWAFALLTVVVMRVGS